MISDPRVACVHSRKSVWLCGVLAAGTLCLALVGCSKPPRATTPEAMHLIQLVYTATNTRNARRLENCRQHFQQLVAENKLGEAEQAEFDRILATAEAGQWEQAQQASLRLAEAQVR
jgi:predicted component of type VI protein secretion system